MLKKIFLSLIIILLFVLGIYYYLLPKYCLTSENGYDYGKIYTSLDTALRNPDQVCALDLSLQNLNNIPPEIGKLKNLRRLSLVQNNIKNLPIEIGSIKRLSYLDLSYNPVAELPDNIGNLKQLVYVDISNTQIKNLPDSFVNLTNLPELHFSGNHLTVIPKSVFALTALRTLDLSFNSLTTIPQDLLKLKKLQYLNLYNNDLNSLPIQFSQMLSLKTLDLRNNPFSENLQDCRPLQDDIAYITKFIPYLSILENTNNNSDVCLFSTNGSRYLYYQTHNFPISPNSKFVSKYSTKPCMHPDGQFYCYANVYKWKINQPQTEVMLWLMGDLNNSGWSCRKETDIFDQSLRLENLNYVCSYNEYSYGVVLTRNGNTTALELEIPN